MRLSFCSTYSARDVTEFQCLRAPEMIAIRACGVSNPATHAHKTAAASETDGQTDRHSGLTMLLSSVMEGD